MVPAPIVLFVYNRPGHTRQTVEALQKNRLARASELIIFSDAAKNGKSVLAVKAIRNYIRSIDGFKSVSIIERAENYGLARSIIDGVSKVCAQYGRVIALEDDMVSSTYFLQYMNDALNFYEHIHKVISIHGYVYPVRDTLPETFFLRGADCWGWATWLRGWRLFEPDGRRLLGDLRRQKMTVAFDLDGAFPYTRMLEDQIAGKNDSWAIRWHASAFLANHLTLYPARSLIQNIGNDATGAHCGKTDAFSVTLSESPINVRSVVLEEDVAARKAIGRFLRVQSGLVRRAVRRFRGVVGI